MKWLTSKTLWGAVITAVAMTAQAAGDGALTAVEIAQSAGVFFTAIGLRDAVQKNGTRPGAGSSAP